MTDSSTDQGPILPQITDPRDLRKLPLDALTPLSDEIRQRIIDVISVTGGHLGSNLGTVELTVALHYVFDFLEAGLVWDVSHQVYTHKILTGRNERFPTTRQLDGLTGFANKFESEYDYFTAGHAGTALSTGLGMAMARKLADDPNPVVAVVGDAAMATGMTFEAMNHGGVVKPNMLVVLNDNCWSISETVGSLRRYLDRIRMRPFIYESKEELKSICEKVPVIGQPLRGVLGRAHELARRVASHGLIFEELGFDYYGPIDGHDVPQLVTALADLKRKGGLNLLHVLTNKGHGIEGAEDHPERCHAATPQPKEPIKVQPSAAPKKARPTYTQVFAEHLERCAAADESVVAITAAMPSGTGLLSFQKRFPDRFYDTGITEQHAAAFASGLADQGLKPVAAIYSTFLQRGYDQVVHDVCIQKNPVVFAMDRAGVVGPDGETHNGVFDIAFLRTLPNIEVLAPKDGAELEAMLDYALARDDISVALRYPRESVPEPSTEKTAPIESGRGELLRTGDGGVLIAIGSMVHRALKAAERLSALGVEVSVVNARFAKPLDVELLVEATRGQPLVMTVEDHALQGGFGEAVLTALAEADAIPAQFRRAGVPDRFLEHGTRDEILERCGLDVDSIVERFAQELGADRVSQVGRFDDATGSRIC